MIQPRRVFLPGILTWQSGHRQHGPLPLPTLLCPRRALIRRLVRSRLPPCILPGAALFPYRLPMGVWRVLYDTSGRRYHGRAADQSDGFLARLFDGRQSVEHLLGVDHLGNCECQL
jgi:hypothetical protein